MTISMEVTYMISTNIVTDLQEILYKEMLQAQLELVNAINEVPQDSIKIEVLQQAYNSKKELFESLE